MRGVITETNSEEAQKQKITTLLNDISFLKIKDQIFSGNDIFINGDFIITNNTPARKPKEDQKIGVIMKLMYQNSQFIVEKIKVSEQDKLNTIIKELLTKKTYSLNEIFEYIEQNIIFYAQDSTTGTEELMCEQIKEELIRQRSVTVNSCTTNEINISKKRNDDIINYEIEFEDYQITNITISDNKIQSEINQQMNLITTNEFNFVDVISSIISYTIPEENIITG